MTYEMVKNNIDCSSKILKIIDGHSKEVSLNSLCIRLLCLASKNSLEKEFLDECIESLEYILNRIKECKS